MKSAIIAASLVAAVSLQAMPSFAQTFTAAPGRTFKLDLDTADGNYSQWATAELTGINAVRVKMAMRRAGADKQYAPSFRFAVESGEDSAAFRAVALGKGAKRILVVYATRIVGGKKTDEMFFTQIELDEVVDLAIDWTAGGKVQFALTSKATRAINGAAETHTVDLGKSPDSLAISNSTSELEILEFKPGTLTP